MSKSSFRRLHGVTEKVFTLMVKIIEKAQMELYKNGGRPCKLNPKEKVEITLQYLRQYGTFLSIGKSFEISESTAHRIVIWTEDILVKSGYFSLPNRHEVMQEENITIDVTESRIERPKKNQKKTFRIRKATMRSKHKQLSAVSRKKSSL
jgi:hypothetical protein